MTNNPITKPTRPYLIQRIELSGDAVNRNGRKNKVDYRTITCVHEGIPETYDGRAVNNPGAYRNMRKRFMAYDYMGSAEFEFGALPQSCWRFLRAFEDKRGSIRVIDLYEGYNGQQERFYVFAPKHTMSIALGFLKLVGMHVFVKGSAYINTKEWLGQITDVLFPETHMRNVESTRKRDIERMRNNEMDNIGWWDVENDFFVLWKRTDIAQAFSNLNGFGDVLSLTPDLIDVSGGGQKLVLPESQEYWTPIIEAANSEYKNLLVEAGWLVL